MSHVALLLIGCIAGIVLLGGTTLGVEYFESDTFCTSCHVMDGVTAEWRESSHFANPSGVAAGCADCHVPPGIVGGARAKVRALHAELWPWLRGVDTPEEMDAHRLELAETVWAHLRATDSASCRSCHQMSEASLELQEPRARRQHLDAVEDGETCIDCHDDGIAHRAVPKPEDEMEEMEEEDFSL